MNIEDAHEQAKGMLKHHIATWKGKFPAAHFEACEIAIEALEMQLPMKAEPINYNPKGDYYGLGCPNCSEIVGQLDNEDASGIYKYNMYANHCPNCGQKIEQNYTEEDYKRWGI